ncbi:hypothetical protein J6590_051593 [Homalodisca vitripennis]|nr:hypothetical protein J6590_051593 [Homalodisca vitripennis]
MREKTTGFLSFKTFLSLDVPPRAYFDWRGWYRAGSSFFELDTRLILKISPHRSQQEVALTPKLTHPVYPVTPDAAQKVLGSSNKNDKDGRRTVLTRGGVGAFKLNTNSSLSVWYLPTATPLLPVTLSTSLDPFCSSPCHSY